jgi:hypothetical protein
MAKGLEINQTFRKREISTADYVDPTDARQETASSLDTCCELRGCPALSTLTINPLRCFLIKGSLLIRVIRGSIFPV